MSTLPITCVAATSIQLFVSSQNSIIFVFAAFVKKIHLPLEKKNTRSTSPLSLISISINKIASLLNIGGFLSFTCKILVMLFMP